MSSDSSGAFSLQRNTTMRSLRDGVKKWPQGVVRLHEEGYRGRYNRVALHGRRWLELLSFRLVVVGDYLRDRLPRPWRLERLPFRLDRPGVRNCRLRPFPNLAGELRIGHPLPDDLRHRETETVCVVHVGPVVIPERLFVDVAEQVEGLDGNVGTVKAALQQTPEVLHGVGVNVPVHVLNGVIDDRVLVVTVKAAIREKFVTEDRRAYRDVVADFALKFILPASLNVSRANLSAALDHSKHP